MNRIARNILSMIIMGEIMVVIAMLGIYSFQIRDSSLNLIIGIIILCFLSLFLIPFLKENNNGRWLTSQTINKFFTVSFIFEIVFFFVIDTDDVIDAGTLSNLILWVNILFHLLFFVIMLKSALGDVFLIISFMYISIVIFIALIYVLVSAFDTVDINFGYLRIYDCVRRIS